MNTTLTAPQQLIENTKELWNQGKKVMIQVAWNLLKIRESCEWEKYGHKTFQQFCQEELDISQSQTSKLIQVADYYLDKYSPEQIGACDYERLYASTKLPGTPEENLSKALTWSRADFKAEKRAIDPNTPEWFKYEPETISRVEVINHADDTGRAYTFWPKNQKLHVSLSAQDDGKTLKIFIENAK